MNLTDPADVFDIANLLVLPGWLWLIAWLFLPNRLQHKTRHGGLVLPLVLSLIYVATAIVHLGSTSGGFDSLENVQRLFAHPGATLVGWVHFLAFDLFVGWLLARHAIATHTHRALVIPCLFLTFMLGPTGLLFYGCLQLARFIASSATHPPLATDRLWHRIMGGQAVLAQCGLVVFFIIPVFLLAHAIDTRSVLDVNVWVKPIKFALALSVYTLSLSWYCNYVSQGWRDSRWFNGLMIATVFAISAELIWLTYAAAIGEPSHFNQTHAVLKILYPVMGGFAVLLTAPSLVIGIGVLRCQSPQLSSLTCQALGYGLIVTFFLTLVTAGYMSGAPAQTHAVLPTAASTSNLTEAVFFLGWLRQAGDLRVAHFFATHALHVLPFLGWTFSQLAAGFSDRTSQRPVVFAIAMTVLYSMFVLWTFAQALGGRPFPW